MKQALFLGLLCFMLSACGGAASCDSKEVRDALGALISDKLLGELPAAGFFGKEIATHLRAPLWRAIKYDFSVLSRNNEGGVIFCEARVESDLPMVDSLRALDQAFKLAGLSGKQEIEYGLGRGPALASFELDANERSLDISYEVHDLGDEGIEVRNLKILRNERI